MASFVLHLGSYQAAGLRRPCMGAAVLTTAHLRDMGPWFESFQNWQPEFPGHGGQVLSIVLRFMARRSKHVNASNNETGRGRGADTLRDECCRRRRRTSMSTCNASGRGRSGRSLWMPRVLPQIV